MNYGTGDWYPPYWWNTPYPPTWSVPTFNTHTAQLCPVCSGKGKLDDFGQSAGYITCHGCDGKGWVSVKA